MFQVGAVIEHKQTGKLYFIIKLSYWNNLLTGERAHATIMDCDNKLVEFGFDFIRSEFNYFA